ncbi:hypothetical protein GMSM_06990 [Geomonas sp. Red276]
MFRAAAAADGQVFNRELFLLRLDGAEDAIGDMLTLSVTSLAKHVAALDRAVQQENVVEIIFLSHTIGGIAATVGAERLSSVATRLELSARKGDLSHQGDLLAGVVKELAAFRHCLDAEWGGA